MPAESGDSGIPVSTPVSGRRGAPLDAEPFVSLAADHPFSDLEVLDTHPEQRVRRKVAQTTFPDLEAAFAIRVVVIGGRIREGCEALEGGGIDRQSEPRDCDQRPRHIPPATPGSGPIHQPPYEREQSQESAP